MIISQTHCFLWDSLILLPAPVAIYAVAATSGSDFASGNREDIFVISIAIEAADPGIDRGGRFLSL